MIPLVTVGRLNPCVLLAFDVPAEQVKQHVPAPLVPVLREGRAFWNVVVCKVDKMRPAGLPRWTGISYVHLAYRIYVRTTAASGETVEGLYFVRSDVNRSIIAVPGNVTSDFRFHTSTIDLRHTVQTLDLTVRSTGGFDATLHVDGPDAQALPDTLLKYQPLGLACDPNGRTLRLAEVFRNEADWQETPVRVTHHQFEFFKTLKQDARLLKATRVHPIDYRWRLGNVRRL